MELSSVDLEDLVRKFRQNKHQQAVAQYSGCGKMKVLCVYHYISKSGALRAPKALAWSTIVKKIADLHSARARARSTIAKKIW